MSRVETHSSDGTPGAVQLVEEAVQLLRRAPAAAWLSYALGMVPCALGLLFFWAHASWFAPSDVQLAWGALGLSVLFVGLKVAQAEFCARLLAVRLARPAPGFSLRRCRRLAECQLRLQPWSFLSLPGAALLTLPFAWVFAFHQNVSVLGGAEGTDVRAESWAEAKRWARQNHLGILLLSLIAGAVWINLASAFYLLPWLANRLLGIENLFRFSGWWALNTTFLASVTILTWIGVDPLVKAFYVLRVFYGRSERTGEDLQLELSGRARARLGRAALLVSACLLVGAALNARAETTGPEALRAVNPASLDQALDEVLAGSDFRWQLPPREEPRGQEKDGLVRRFLRQGVQIVEEMLNSIQRAFRSLRDWFRDLWPEREKPAAGTVLSSSAVLHLLLYGLIAVLGLLLVALLVLALQRTRANRPASIQAQTVKAQTLDLQDESLVAAQLPVDGWLALAREQIGRGEWRLALRALYLATLAGLAAEGLIQLARSKTNLDYERELRRRAAGREALLARFTEHRRTFEAVWYGSEHPDEALVRAWLAEREGGAP